MKRFTSYWLLVIPSVKDNLPTVLMMYESSLPKWVMRCVEFNKLLRNHIATKLTTYNGDVWIVEEQFNQKNWGKQIKYFTSHRTIANNERDLPTVWWCVKIKNFTKNNKYEKEHFKKLSIKNKHWNHLTSNVNDAWGVAIQKYFRHMQYESGFG